MEEVTEIRGKEMKQEAKEALSLETKTALGAGAQEIQEVAASTQSALIPCR